MPTPVPVNDAVIQTTDWRDYIDPIAGNAAFHAFFLPIANLNAILPYAENGIRVYGALKIQNDPSSFHLLAVAVDKNGNDVVETPQASMVYGDTMPCPNMCGGSSPLNGL